MPVLAVYASFLAAALWVVATMYLPPALEQSGKGPMDARPVETELMPLMEDAENGMPASPLARANGGGTYEEMNGLLRYESRNMSGRDIAAGQTGDCETEWDDSGAQIDRELEDASETQPVSTPPTSTGGRERSPASWHRPWVDVIGKRLLRAWNHPVVTNPLLASISGLLLALIPQVKELVVEPSAPLNWLFEGAVKVGAAATPLAMIIMGAQLHASLSGPRSTYEHANSEGRKGGCLSCKASLGVLVSGITRLFLVPCGAIALMWPLSLLQVLRDDPLLILVLITEASTPGALNLILIAMRNGSDSQGIARLLMWQYIASVLTLSVVLSVAIEMYR